MAFPGTYNINYYKGDTFEFRIYPKDSAGNQFALNDYTQFRFTISNVRGSTAPEGVTKVTINGYAAERDNQYILCAIKPEDGEQLIAGTTYYYDVEIGRISDPYDFVYTLLQGTITVSEEVTLPLAIPNPPQSVNLVFPTSTSATISWTPPTGVSPTYYNAYVVSPVPFQINQEPIPASETSLTVNLALLPAELLPFFLPGTPIVVGVTSENISGESAPATASGFIPVES
jgi:hypothetical protein